MGAESAAERVIGDGLIVTAHDSGDKCYNMRTPWTFFFALVFAFWGCWRYVPLASIAAEWVGFAVLVPSLSYWLARYLWCIVFVKLVSGDGKAVLVVGCDTGFGHLLVRSLSNLGFFVYAGCLNASCDGADQLKKLANVKVLQLDISSERQVSDALAIIKGSLGSMVLWAVVCNAGIRNKGLLEWMTMDTMERVIDVNILGTCRVAKTFLPLLKKSNGRLVVVTSSLGYVTMPVGTPYSMTKYALVSMVDGLRRECYGKGIDIIQVTPQAYKTSITAPLLSRGFTRDELKESCPEIADDFTQEEINGWIRCSNDFFEVFGRENIQEATDVMVSAVSETDPKTCYTTPLSLCTAALFPCTYLPDEAADAYVAFARTKLAPLSDMLTKRK